MSKKARMHVAARLMPILLLIAALCTPMGSWAQQSVVRDPLPSWQEGQAKLAILGFVREVTDKSGTRYVTPEDRIATFDDDGTLWPEWPRHVNQIQMVFVRQRVKEMEKDHLPDWHYREPFRAILKGDDDAIALVLTDLWNRMDLLRETSGSMSVDEFGARVRRFLATARHPGFNVPYTEVAYQPMLELLDLLRANQFKIFIVTSGGADFVRELSEQVFGIPRECVIGSSADCEYEETPDGKGNLVRTPNVEVFNDKAAKAKNIQLHIGRRPIFTAGNNDSDLAMMGFAAGGKNPFLNLLVRHDDGNREFAYGEGASKVLQAARARGWTTVSMKNDFRIVFSFRGD